MKYRWLEGDELSRLDALLELMRWPALNPAVARALVAETDDGDIVGFHVVQLVPHAEPQFVVPEFRGTGISEELADKMLEFLHEMDCRRFFVVADSPFAAKLCRERGMKALEQPVFVLPEGVA